MKREEFVKSVTEQVEHFIENFYEYGQNAQLRVNPELKYVEIEGGNAFLDDIEYSDEVVENAAYAEGDATESADDFQARQDYDYYPMREFIRKTGDHTAEPNKAAIDDLAGKYFA